MGYRILITDDAAFMRMMLKTILEQEGHEVLEAVNGEDMLAKYEEVKPDLVTLDITMPVMDGLQAIKALMPKHPEAKVIMCSAMGQQVMVLDAIKAGAKDFIVKPFKKDRVVEAIERAFKQV